MQIHKKDLIKNQKNYLIVGGNSISGQAIIAAIQEHHLNQNTPCHIVATSSQKADIQNADQSLSSIDLTQSDACQSIERQLQTLTNIDFIFYTPAKGVVGMPVDAATENQIQASIDFSLKPMLQLSNSLQPKLSIGLSGFAWTEVLFKTYGAMLYAKIVLELLAQRQPQRFKVLRIGFFASHSSRAVFLMARKNMARGLYQQVYSSWQEICRAKQKKMKELMEELIYSSEQKEFSKHFNAVYRLTQTEDIKKGVKKLIAGNTKPIVNVLGNGYWEEEEAYANWSPDIFAKAEAIYTQLQ